MRISIICPDFKIYLEHPEEFLPEKVMCLRDPSHHPHRHTTWKRFLVVDHNRKVTIPMYRWYCPECKESISIWPEFVLPYQSEVAETHEQAVVEHLAGRSFTDTANDLGYDPRTVARWVKRVLTQAFCLAPRLAKLLLDKIPDKFNFFSSVTAFEITQKLLAWLRKYAELISFSRFYRLIGLGNILGKGRFIIWGGAVGRCRYGQDITQRFPC
jgi:hypothetical protein